MRDSRNTQWRYSTELACRDLMHEWKISACLVLALAAVLTPLLVLFGLKSGLVHTLTERLKADPRNLQVIVKGNNRLTPEWLEQLRQRPETGFLVPRTRTLAATLNVVGVDNRSVQSVDALPTDIGDPSLPTGTPVPRGLTEALLSHTLAAKLGVTDSGSMRATARRRHHGEAQSLNIPLTVTAVLPETVFGRDALFVSVALLDALEDYRDQYRVPALGVHAGAAPRQGQERIYSGVRLYAKSLDAVAPLAEYLRDDGYDVVTRARDIELVRGMDRTLGFVFAVIAAVGVTGFLLSLASSLWANVDRKRRELAMLRLVGLRSACIVWFPAAQALIVAAVGIVLSLILYAGVSTVFNAVLAENLRGNEFVSYLAPVHALAAGLMTLLCALAAAAIGGYRASRIEPAECLREG